MNLNSCQTLGQVGDNSHFLGAYLFSFLPTLGPIFKWRNIPALQSFSCMSEFSLRDETFLEAVTLKH